jgi:hypothetical protein
MSMAAPGTNSRPYQNAFMYVDAERMGYIEIKAGRMRGGTFYPKKPLAGQNSPPFETLESDVYDCSDANFRCVTNGDSIFAVPKGQLQTQESYKVRGAEFTVKQCLRGADRNCQIAVISTDCALLSSPGFCKGVPGGRNDSPHPGGAWCFIYNEDFGITSLGSGIPKSAEALDATARKLVLQGDVGLLKQ